jgi:hypothetical protein
MLSLISHTRPSTKPTASAITATDSIAITCTPTEGASRYRGSHELLNRCCSHSCCASRLRRQCPHSRVKRTGADTTRCPLTTLTDHCIGVPFLAFGTACEFHPRSREPRVIFPRCKMSVRNRGLFPVVNRSDEYRRFAAECLKIAQAAEDEKQRALFLQMARAWLALAQKDDDCDQRLEDEIK